MSFGPTEIIMMWHFIVAENYISMDNLSKTVAYASLWAASNKELQSFADTEQYFGSIFGLNINKNYAQIVHYTFRQ